MPQLQHVFRRHGDLSLLEGFSLHSDDEGYIVNRWAGMHGHLQDLGEVGRRHTFRL